MKILHYCLGYPPYRSGGLTKFAIDLAEFQAKQGNWVGVIWPGHYSSFRDEISFKKSKHGLTTSFEMINPMPVSLLNGIIDVDIYIQKRNCFDSFIVFLNKYTPDIIHVHTLMGLPKEFLEAARSKKIKLVLTTHDFFGICPTVNLFVNGHRCDGNPKPECLFCNRNAFSFRTIKLMQSSLYRVLKNTFVFSFLRKRKRKAISKKTENELFNKKDCFDYRNYIRLQEYYLSFFAYFDIIHNNSSVSNEVFARFVDSSKTRIKAVTHSGIVDHRDLKTYKPNCSLLRMLYLGPENDKKGFGFLIDVLDELWQFDQNFVLEVHSNDDFFSRPYIIKYGAYRYQDLRSIFERADINLVFSLCYETFGFTVLEALSYGVPSVTMQNVGSKDLIQNGINGFVVSNKQEALKTLKNIVQNKNAVIPHLIDNIKTMPFIYYLDSIGSYYD